MIKKNVPPIDSSSSRKLGGFSQLQSQKATLTSFVFAQSFGSRFRRRAFLAGVDVLTECQAAMRALTPLMLLLNAWANQVNFLGRGFWEVGEKEA